MECAAGCAATRRGRRCAGRGIGLIDTRFFANRLFDAFAILERTGDLTAEDLTGLKVWFARYLDWMMTSSIGLDEQDEHNNHGTAYDLQAATYAHFVGKDDLARKILENDTKKRMASQIQPDGSQPHELARTRSRSISTSRRSSLRRFLRVPCLRRFRRFRLQETS